MAKVVEKINNALDLLEGDEKAKDEIDEELDLSNLLVLGGGNPLLDISNSVDDKFMKKYGIKPANAILAAESHLPMYDELAKMKNVEYIAGGATLNSIRVCQWMLQKKNSTGYYGCIGKDKFGELLSKKMVEDGVIPHLLIQNKVSTGTCAVCITDKERSLVANLAAANEYKDTHIKTKQSGEFIKNAKVFYSAGFFITVSPETMEYVAEASIKAEKPYCLNFSAPFIVSVFGKQLLKIFELSTHVFTNEDEAKAFATANKIEYKDMKELALKISKMKTKRKEGRKVIITQGKDPVVIAHNDKVTEYKVPLIKKEKIVDTNGAGDGFVGGFLSQLAQGKGDEICVKAGNYAASVIIQTSGTKVSGKPSFTAK